MIGHIAYLVLARAAGATRTPEEAIAILNVLSEYRAPAVLDAALSRGFNEISPALAVKHGHGHTGTNNNNNNNNNNKLDGSRGTIDP
ncbi:hypothetical protein BC828DRAFT_389094, partial [Blastocladiella britannica]